MKLDVETKLAVVQIVCAVNGTIAIVVAYFSTMRTPQMVGLILSMVFFALALIAHLCQWIYTVLSNARRPKDPEA